MSTPAETLEQIAIEIDAIASGAMFSPAALCEHAETLHALARSLSERSGEEERIRPVKWAVAPEPDVYNYHEAIHVEERQQRDGTRLYAVTRRGFVWTREGLWEWEPQPSSRDVEYIARARYASPAEALASLPPTRQEGDGIHG